MVRMLLLNLEMNLRTIRILRFVVMSYRSEDIHTSRAFQVGILKIFRVTWFV
jgi:hypothetical protein